MEIRLLTYFLSVAREENITKAANTLHIAQPSLSKQMMELEEQLGKTLFIRGKRKIQLTEEGRLLRKRAEEILDLVNKTENEIKTADNTIQGCIGIGGSFDPLQDAIIQFSKDYLTSISFDLFNGDAISVKEKIDQGLLDFGVLLQPVDLTKYDYVSLPTKYKWGVLLKKGYLKDKTELSVDDLLNIPLVMHKRDELQRVLSHWSKREMSDFKILATYNIFSNYLLSFVQNGLGGILTVEGFVDTSIYQDLEFYPLTPNIDVQYALVWKRYQVLNKACQKFIEYVEKQPH